MTVTLALKLMQGISRPVWPIKGGHVSKTKRLSVLSGFSPWRSLRQSKYLWCVHRLPWHQMKASFSWEG